LEEEGLKRTSLIIQNKVATHITPGGLADETYDFVNELNSVDHQEKLEQFDLAAWVR
jgi:hypothetical protein